MQLLCSGYQSLTGLPGVHATRQRAQALAARGCQCFVLVIYALCLVRIMLYLHLYLQTNSLVCSVAGATSGTQARWGCLQGTFGAKCSSLMPRSSYSCALLPHLFNVASCHEMQVSLCAAPSLPCSITAIWSHCSTSVCRICKEQYLGGDMTGVGASLARFMEASTRPGPQQLTGKCPTPCTRACAAW